MNTPATLGPPFTITAAPEPLRNASTRIARPSACTRTCWRTRLRASLSARESCEIMLTLAEVWRMTGLWVRARAMLQEALAIAETLADSRLVAQTQAALAGVLHLLGYYDAALEMAGAGRGEIPVYGRMARGCQHALDPGPEPLVSRRLPSGARRPRAPVAACDRDCRRVRHLRGAGDAGHGPREPG